MSDKRSLEQHITCTHSHYFTDCASLTLENNHLDKNHLSVVQKEKSNCTRLHKLRLVQHGLLFWLFVITIIIIATRTGFSILTPVDRQKGTSIGVFSQWSSKQQKFQHPLIAIVVIMVVKSESTELGRSLASLRMQVELVGISMN